MKCAVTSLDNKKAGEIDLDESIFGLVPRVDI
ncbi:MAG: 50S ribosomal protein L4, partial [Hyphomicrobiales bacterium]